MDKPDPSAAVPFALPGQHVVSLEGRDAQAFAQAQTMNDLAALGDGHWHWNGWLTPKGRVIALFVLLRLDAERLWLLLPDADPRAVADGLRRFVFRSKVKIEVRDDLRVAGAFAAPATAQGAAAGIAAEGDRVELDLGGDGGPRMLRIAAQAAPENRGYASRWRSFDLAHGLPRLEAEQAEQWTPQQLSLGRLRAYSVKKGCYPGQEIVSRTHFLGKAKRGLVLLEADAGEIAGSEVRSQGQAIGTVASRAGRFALAVLPLEREAGAALQVEGMAVSERTLLDGLAR